MFSPQFQISNRILMNISKIEAVEEVIRHAPILPLWEKEFREDAIVRSVYHGTHLEGNMLQKDEALNVLKGKDVMARARDIQEVINYRKVIDFIDQQAKENNQHITEELIQKIHGIVVNKILPPDQAGAYRTKQVVIRNSQTGEITFKPPIPVEVPYLIKEFISWVNRTTKDDLHPILKAGIAHHEFVRIHPFADGNGRVGRSLTTLLLQMGGFDIRRFFSLEEYYDRDAIMYYESLQKASNGDMTAWLEYFTYGAAVEFEKIKDKILRLSKDAKLKERFGGKQIFLTERQVKIIEYIQEIGYLQNQAFGSIFPDLSEDSILRDIKDLIEKGLIKKVGKTKAARYVLTG
ncbi:MAG TPA: Fic family protein [Candidatus Woesebacteria bacterium]|nr:Fic family protein [Candidatus Woesebacteria bacterium]